MKHRNSIKAFIIQTISYLYILLFVYASVSKLLDFENFQIQLGQSPLLSAYAGVVSVFIIIAELLTAVLLSLRRTRLIGLYLSTGLMVSFTVYIYLILNYSEFVPCSCGGVLEKLGWTEHLVFNLVFVGLGAWAICIIEKRKNSKSFSMFSKLILLAILSSAVVMVLFFSSEHIIKKENPFIRSFPPHVVEFEKQIDLKYNSYYFSGSDEGTIYLGNNMAPLHALAIDTSLQHKIDIKILPEKSNFKFRSVQLRVLPPDFYLLDGSVPCIYSGKISDWNARLKLEGSPYFTSAEPMSSDSFVFRSNSIESGENILGTLKLGNSSEFKLSERLLQKESKGDGIFDTDGSLLYNNESMRIIYLYRYRNQFVVADREMNVIYRGNTIDTVSHAQIEVTQLEGERTMSAPPLSVNISAATYHNLLFVNSSLRGKHDSKKAWEMSSTIDVYDLEKRNYLFSFYIAGLNGKKATKMLITSEKIYVIVDHQLMMYRVKNALKNKLRI